MEIKNLESFVNPDQVKNKKYAEKGDLLIATTSENLKDSGKACVYLGEQKCLIGNHVAAIKSKENSRFLAYSFSCDFTKSQIELLTNQSTVYDLYLSKIKKIKVPIPSLEEQAKVADQLDKLFKIVNDLNDGIPMMIEKNRKQYNFYKELLLEISSRSFLSQKRQ